MATTIGLCLAALIGVAGWYFYWNAHAKRFVESGYVPPESGWFGMVGFAAFSYLLTFLTVGKVKVVKKGKLPKGRLIFAGNHQLPVDFAMLRRAAGRHFRMLTDSEQLSGFFGLLCAAGGVISVGFKNKTDGAKAEEACKRAMSAKGFYLPPLAAATAALLAVAGFVASIMHGTTLGAIASVLMVLAVAACPGRKPALGIFPQGGLLPDDPQLKENFRPGAVRIGREAEERSHEPVMIVPVAIYYEHDPKFADWTHRYLKGMRSMFLGTRNPKAWNPLFKKDLSGLPEEERVAIEAERKEIMRAHRKSNCTNYRGVVIRGEAIDASTLPADPIEAINVIHKKVAELLAEAGAHG